MSSSLVLTFSGVTNITLPITGVGLAVSVDWGDGPTNTSLSHIYTSSFTGTVSITVTAGTVTQFGTGSSSWIGGDKLTTVATSNDTSSLNWGLPGITSLDAAFYEATILTSVPNYIPNTIVNLHKTFSNCNVFNQDIGSWDTSNVTNMGVMFDDCNVFNQDIGSWDTSNVMIMTGMFRNCNVFNQDIGSWNTVKVTMMSSMFNNCNVFNQDIGSWNTVKVTDMSNMFWKCYNFNKDLNRWDTSIVTNTRSMFQEAFAFNGNISSWNVSNISYMEDMFRNASAFNQDIGNWDVSNINNISMNQMFDGCIVFNQNLSNWNVSNFTRMTAMFRNCNNFNQDISGWDVSNVTDMRFIFQDAEDFSQKIYVWKPDDCNLFSGMFSGATSMLDRFSGFPGMGTTPTKGSEASPGFFYLVDSPYLSLITGDISVALYNPTNDDPYVEGLTTEELRQSLS